ncbi:DUF2798 domain-containing protein [Methylobacterium oxalidis]|uniref:GNAT family acetyltransferase n=1 Tax=Methylobacterium oxalidis TaxID=944322 RepID=A0A512J053_9HYPH|nr:DUF2798 domain-containing protein [Methylobacterium oxalidis]GEP03332.1 GNAT family acetyltransferase [Methylobacterium oxalidis]GJE30427.1 hypothetical protein LDDCCGHA_0595 [Methylobacterium oxalidis]GLS64162.1 GNAT family acetyltransferase [Methylobacterium oxalidis]
MLGLSRRHSHFVYGVIQSGLTCGIASGIASVPLLAEGAFLASWLRAWLLAWAAMLPVVILAAPLIRRLADALTLEEQG